MSSFVFPTLPTQVFPVERESEWPGVVVDKTPTGRAFVTSSATFPLLKWNVEYSALSHDDANTLADFFDLHGGGADSFLFEDGRDNTAEDQLIGVGNGVIETWQLGRSRSSGPFTFLHPVFDVVPGITVKVNDVATASYTLGDTGSITFTGAPTGPITWSGTFRHRVRFDLSRLSRSQFAHQLNAFKRVSLVSHKP